MQKEATQFRNYGECDYNELKRSSWGFWKNYRDTDMDDILKYFTTDFEPIPPDVVDEKKLRHLVNAKGIPILYFGGNHFTGTVVCTYLLKNKGILTATAMDMGISRKKLVEYIDTNPLMQEAMSDIEDIVLDFVEAKLLQNVEKGDKTSINYYLNTQGVTRGYGTYEQRRRMQKIVKPNPSQDKEGGTDFEII